MPDTHRPSSLPRLVALVALVCAAGIGLLLWLDAPAPTPTAHHTDTPISGPDLADSGRPVVDLGDPDLNVELAEGGWVQVAGADGELAQQYRFDHLDPDPDGLPAQWLRMDAPIVQMYLTGGRVVTLSGKSLDAYAPSRALEQGRLDGDVLIRLYEGGDAAAGTLDTTTLEPALTVRTAFASFDNLAGRIECPGAITADSPTERLAGRDLLVLMNDHDNRIEFLRLKHVDYLALQERDITADRAAPARQREIFKTANRRMEADPVHWYQVQLDANVRIEQDDTAGRRLALGDRLDVVFSMASTPITPGSGSTAGVPSLGSALGAVAMAVDPVASATPGEIIVSCDGPLTMVPLPEGVEAPPKADAARMMLTGSPVRLLDTSDRMGALATTLTWRSETDRIDLRSGDAGPVTVMTDDLWLQTDNLWAEMATGLAGSTDTAGSAHMTEQSPLTLALASEQAADINPERPEPLEEDLTIDWSGGVDVHFEPEGQAGAGGMKLVRFQGDVEVRSPDGAIDAQTLEMHFLADEAGHAHPDRLYAAGDVRARNDEQTLFSDVLTATLEQPVPDSDDAAIDTAEAAGDDPMANARVKDFFAQGDVQVLLADGARAFADELEGDARQEQVTLKGGNIVIARSDLLIEHGREIMIERKLGKATWPGGGRARLLARPIDVTQDYRITRPAVPAPTQAVKRVVTMQATWDEGLLYDANFGKGAGALDLRGKVAVVAQQQPTERSSLHGGALRLEFATLADATTQNGDAAAKPTAPAPTTTGGFGSNSRVLSKMIATDKARLERRTWPTDDRLETPEILYISGDRVLWDDLASAANVTGKGDFVTRQPEWATGERDGPFRGPGTARFTWARALDMKRRTDGHVSIELDGMVEGMWKGADSAQDVATLTADKVMVKTRRDLGDEGTSNAGSPLNFDSNASIESLIASGRVYLATPSRQADADTLHYNTRSGIARLEGRPGNPVVVVNKGAALPVRATAMVWNMDPDVDTITLENPRGVGGR